MIRCHALFVVMVLLASAVGCAAPSGGGYGARKRAVTLVTNPEGLDVYHLDNQVWVKEQDRLLADASRLEKYRVNLQPLMLEPYQHVFVVRGPDGRLHSEVLVPTEDVTVSVDFTRLGAPQWTVAPTAAFGAAVASSPATTGGR
jgi:hypothetical protein